MARPPAERASTRPNLDFYRASLQYAMIILFRVDQALHRDASAARMLGDKVVSEASNRPKADVRVICLAKLAR